MALLAATSLAWAQPSDQEPEQKITAADLEEPVIPEFIEPDSLGESPEQRSKRIIEASLKDRPTTFPINTQIGVPADGQYVLSPGRSYLKVKPGEELETTIILFSRAGEDVLFDVIVRDVGIDPELGGISFLSQAADGPFPSKKWIQPAVREIVLHHGEQAFIPVKIRVPLKVDAGDHMATILLKKRNLMESKGGFTINAFASSVLVITVEGDVVESGAFQKFSPSKYLNWKTPVDLNLTVENTGSVHIAPRGKITIDNIFGITVDEFQINNRWNVLRGSRMTQPMEWAPRFALGYYKASTNVQLFTPGNKGEIPTEQRTTTFWVVPLIPLIIVSVAVFVVSFLVQFFFSRFEIKTKKKSSDSSTDKP
jgi:hypothetical protein